MCDLSETTRIINAENQEQLISVRNEEINKIHKLELLLSLIRKMSLKELNIADTGGIEKAIKIISFQNYLKLDEFGGLLGLGDFKNIELSYTERKAIRNYIIDKIHKECTPITNFAEKMTENIPNIFDPSKQQDEIIELEEHRRSFMLKLAEIKRNKCELLKICAQLKIGPHLKNELELMNADQKLNQIKANTLKGYLLNELFSRTEHTIKAIKEVKGFIDAELQEEE